MQGSIICDVSTGQETHRFDYDRRIYAAQFSPDGRSVFVLDGHTLRLIEVESGAEIWQLRQSGFSLTAAFSPCGRWVITAPQGQLWLLDATTGEEVRRFEGHTDTITSVQFLPDSRHIISGSTDRTMRLWNVQTGQEIACLTAEKHFTNIVAVSPDGRYAASGGGHFVRPPHEYLGDGDYDLRLWRLPESVWPKDAADAPPSPADASQGDVEKVNKITTPTESTEQVDSSAPENTPAAVSETAKPPAEDSTKKQPMLEES